MPRSPPFGCGATPVSSATRSSIDRNAGTFMRSSCSKKPLSPRVSMPMRTSATTSVAFRKAGIAYASPSASRRTPPSCVARATTCAHQAVPPAIKPPPRSSAATRPPSSTRPAACPTSAAPFAWPSDTGSHVSSSSSSSSGQAAPPRTGASSAQPSGCATRSASASSSSGGVSPLAIASRLTRDACANLAAWMIFENK
eukprot:2464318-Prymnesium_polylepis.1